jgi:hypothetical protein
MLGRTRIRYIKTDAYIKCHRNIQKQIKPSHVHIPLRKLTTVTVNTLTHGGAHTQHAHCCTLLHTLMHTVTHTHTYVHTCAHTNKTHIHKQCAPYSHSSFALTHRLLQHQRQRRRHQLQPELRRQPLLPCQPKKQQQQRSDGMTAAPAGNVQRPTLRFGGSRPRGKKSGGAACHLALSKPPTRRGPRGGG